MVIVGIIASFRTQGEINVYRTVLPATAAPVMSCRGGKRYFLSSSSVLFVWLPLGHSTSGSLVCLWWGKWLGQLPYTAITCFVAWGKCLASPMRIWVNLCCPYGTGGVPQSHQDAPHHWRLHRTQLGIPIPHHPWCQAGLLVKQSKGRFCKAHNKRR